MSSTETNPCAPPELPSSGAKPSFVHSFLISSGLIFLAFPNLLFLWGWFTPPAAVASSLLILFAVGRAIRLSFTGVSTFPRRGGKRCLLFSASAAAAALIVLLSISSVSGILGCVPAFGDILVLREAMFCSLRDAPWPLVLPNGKEMSYYLANILPPALLARCAPEAGHWMIALWTLLGLMIALLLLSHQLKGRRTWCLSLLLFTLLIAIFCGPFASDSPFLLPKLHSSYLNPLRGSGCCYNSYPPALLAGALIFSCRNRPGARPEVLLPVVLSLLVPLSPLGGIGLLPLAAVVYIRHVRNSGGFSLKLLWDAPLPLCMAFLSAVYFTRADGPNVITLTLISWSWKPLLALYSGLIISWVFLLFPLWKAAKHDPFFIALAVCNFLCPLIFIGTMGGCNELWLKSAPVYTLLMVCYWFKYWPGLGRVKYLIIGIGLLAAINTFAKQIRHFDASRYLVVEDLWNGHLNHDHPFLNQSIPPCKEPMAPGVLLRRSGESEEHFPGCLLRRAPGCDYSAPPSPKARELRMPDALRNFAAKKQPD